MVDDADMYRIHDGSGNQQHGPQGIAAAVNGDDARLMNQRLRGMAGMGTGPATTGPSSSSSLAPESSSTSTSTSPPPLVLKTNHLDYIHDIAFDTYGRRMASCSGDRFVRVWDLRGGGATIATTAGATATATGAAPAGEAPIVRDAWACTASWQAHRGSVTCLSWCHPEYGTLLATAGLDQEVKIWEERSAAAGGGGGGVGVVGVAATNGGGGGTTPHNPNGAASAANSPSLWTLRASLADAKRAVTCVAFAPRHYGLKLASASSDGIVRLYEAIDVVNVGSWPLSATLHVYGTDGSVGGRRGDPEYDEYDHSSAAGHRRHAPGGGGGDGPSSSSHWLTLSWCTGRFDPPTLVVGGGTVPTTEASAAMAAATTNASGTSAPSSNTTHALVIYRYTEGARAWLPLRILPRMGTAGSNKPTPGISLSPALCVAWAPNVGRRYHYVAAAYGDALVVYKLKRSSASGSKGADPAAASASAPSTAPPSTTTEDLELESAQVLPTPSAWRCQWNVTGTVLACSGDLGTVQLYKAVPHSGHFQLVSEIHHPEEHE